MDNFSFSEEKRSKNSVFKIISFRDATLPLWDMHPTRVETGPDCTHFCWSPLLYQSIFAHLSDISQKALQSIWNHGRFNMTI